MKDFAKSIRTMNSNKEEIIKKKKQEGATLKVDNGQKLEFSDGSTFVKTSFSEDYREAKNYTGNKKVGNGIKEDLIKIDSLAKDVKASATYEAIKKEPWRVYDILGVGDSVLREEAFELIEKKYGIPYEDLYNAWLRKKWEVGNKKVGNTRIGNIDPRIPAFKAKIPNLVKIGDVWHLKDIKRFSDDMVKSLKQQILELEEIKDSYKDWYDFSLSVEKAIDEAEKNK